jgi:hypothetical protein
MNSWPISRALLAHRVQLTTDGLKMYLNPVADGFGKHIDYAMLVKAYGSDPVSETRYSPAIWTARKPDAKIGNPERKHISTSYRTSKPHHADADSSVHSLDECVF